MCYALVMLIILRTVNRLSFDDAIECVFMRKYASFSFFSLISIRTHTHTCWKILTMNYFQWGHKKKKNEHISVFSVANHVVNSALHIPIIFSILASCKQFYWIKYVVFCYLQWIFNLKCTFFQPKIVNIT